MTSELFSLGIMVPCLGVDMEAQKSLRNSVFLPRLAADGVYEHNCAVPSTVRHAGRAQERPAFEVSARLLSQIKRLNPLLADPAVLAAPWLLLRSRKSVLLRLTRPGCRSSSCQAFPPKVFPPAGGAKDPAAIFAAIADAAERRGV